MVTAKSVMSRDFISDFGSDLNRVIGGALSGMEESLRAAVAAARRDLSTEARRLGCDHVIGVMVSIAGVGDKAQAIVMAGTAVQTTSSFGQPDGADTRRQ